MRKLALGVIIVLVLAGTIFFIIQERNSEIMVESNDESMVRLDEEDMIVTVVSGITVDELVDSIDSSNRLDLTFDVTTNEGNQKQKSVVYSYDLLYIEAKRKNLDVTYSVRTVESFD